MKIIAFVPIGGSAVAFAFLFSTLTHLERLGIGISHPRVPVEAGLGIAALSAGVLLLMLS